MISPGTIRTSGATSQNFGRGHIGRGHIGRGYIDPSSLAFGLAISLAYPSGEEGGILLVQMITT
jgi:hypothetical protein